MKQKVFGIGLQRTGTTTLMECLRAVDYRVAEFNMDLLYRYRMGDSVATIMYLLDFDAAQDLWPKSRLNPLIHTTSTGTNLPI